MNSRSISSVVVAFLIVAGAAFAQDRGPVAPEATDLEVPEMILRVQELDLQEVDAVLPSGGELVLGQIDVPLPAAGDLSIDEAAFSVRSPSEIGSGLLSPSVFTSGRLGAGSSNFILGELELYRLGVNPEFRLRFRHESLDGYAFSAPGTGFFAYQNLIDAEVEATTGDRLYYEVQGEFAERVDGLQGLSSFYSVGVRTTQLNGTLRFLPDPLVRVEGDVDARLTTRIQSEAGSESVPTEREIAVAPTVTGVVTVSAVDIVVEAGYDGRFLADEELPAEHLVNGGAGVDLTIGDTTTVEARAGVSWEPGSALRYPWSIAASAVLGSVDLRISGGYEVEPIRLSEIWAAMPLASVQPEGSSADIVTNPRWIADSGATWYASPSLTLGAGVGIAANDQALRIDGFDTVSEQFATSQTEATTLEVRADLAWRPSELVSVEGGWSSSFLDLLPGEPSTSLGAIVRVSDRSERVSAAVDAELAFYPEFVMPEINFTTSYTPTDELEFVLAARDVLAPLMEEGRPAFGPVVSSEYPFIAPGFTASISARISL